MKACKAKAPVGRFPVRGLGRGGGCLLSPVIGFAYLANVCSDVHWKQQGVVTAFLGERFDEQGADLISDWIFTLELDPFQLAVDCYPVLQIALYIYMAGHLPLAITVAPIVEAT